ncbi:uncharacterized protein FOMMEDRAFT_156723, partial [Fomitiporia mediterranea MF3/22]|uniref:uncharacterized protein n=1 Tax=Fomitiporia mediterranea (strain MF3/22) TaxID=694068 RepID=UPI00044072A0
MQQRKDAYTHSRFLTVTPKKGPEKADAWFQRSGGILTDLHIVGEFSSDDRSRMFKDAASTIWSSLDTLTIITRSSSDDVFSVLPPTAVDGLRPRKFVVYSKKLNDESLRALTNVDGSRMRHFALTTFCSEIRVADFNFTSLTTLMLCAPVSFWDLSLLLKKNPLLENLVLESRLASISPDGDVEDLELDHLVRLELINSAFTRHCLEQVRFPNLKTLVVRHNSAFDIPALIDGQKLAALEHLTLSILV